MHNVRLKWYFLLCISGNFIADFNKTPQRSLNTGQSVSITNISADNCARLCVENTGFSCQTFTYCTSSTRCIILGDSVKSSRSQIQTSKSCDLYSSKYLSYELRFGDNQIFAYTKTKPQISFAVIAQLISAIVFATWLVQSLFYLNSKFHASSLLL